MFSPAVSTVGFFLKVLYIFWKIKNGVYIYVTVEAKSSCLKYCSKFAPCLMAIAFSFC